MFRRKKKKSEQKAPVYFRSAPRKTVHPMNPGCVTLHFQLARAYGSLLLEFVGPLISPVVQMRLPKQRKANQRSARRGVRICARWAEQGVIYYIIRR